MMKRFLALGALCSTARAYWLMGMNNVITTQRIDPIVNPGAVAGHAHTVVGGSNFGLTLDTAKLLQSECTSTPIPQDKSNYWVPTMYFHWNNGSFSSVNGNFVIYYLFDDKPGTTTAFPADFRMLSGTPSLRTYDPNSFAQQAVDFLCLDFNGQTTRHTGLPNKHCPSGIRSQVNFPSCWDGKNVDSPDHKSHVAFKSDGPDRGSCKDPKFPVTLPRIFMETYWETYPFKDLTSQAMNPNQPFVFSNGDPTGYGYHGDFFNGWAPGVLQKAVDGCTCNQFGDPTCCVEKGIFDFKKDPKCFITNSLDEPTLGMLPKLPGNNPVQGAGTPAKSYKDENPPALISPVHVYTGNAPTATGKVVGPAPTGAGSPSPNPPIQNPPNPVPPPKDPVTTSAAAVPTSSKPVEVLSSTSAKPVEVVSPVYPPQVTPTSTVVVATSSALPASSNPPPVNLPLTTSFAPAPTTSTSIKQLPTRVPLPVRPAPNPPPVYVPVPLPAPNRTCPKNRVKGAKHGKHRHHRSHFNADTV